MKRLGFGLIVCLVAGAAFAQQAGKERPTWAYPTLAAIAPGKEPNPPLEGPQSLPGSTKHYTIQEAELSAVAADWYPERHAPQPKIVRDGSTNGGFACGACHMATGFGHAESASLVGLTPEYFIKTMREFRSGERNDPIRMTCHGPDLTGRASPVPSAVGNHPLYIVRQLFDFKSGTRNGPDAQQMKLVVENLTDADMIDLAAYLGTIQR